MAPLRWGLLGTAHINRRLIPVLQASARSQVAAVASRSPERAAAYARDWRIPTVAPSYDALLARDDVDIIYIPLPNGLHVEWTLRAIAAGKHVLCEKPLALAAEDVDTIAAAAAAAGSVVTEGFMYRHHARTHRVLEMLTQGAIGELCTITSSFSYRRSREADVRLDPSLGGGALWDVGCYPVSFAQMCAAARPVHVNGLQIVGPTGVDEQFTGTIAYANGVQAQVTASFLAEFDTWVRLSGTRGTITIEHPFRPEPEDVFTLQRDGSREEVHVSGAAIFVDEIADMEDAVLGRTPSRITLADSRLHAATLQALHQAARERRTVAIGA